LHQSTPLLSILTNYFQNQLKLDRVIKDGMEGKSGVAVAPSPGASALGQAARPPNGAIKGGGALSVGLFWPALAVVGHSPY